MKTAATILSLAVFALFVALWCGKCDGAHETTEPKHSAPTESEVIAKAVSDFQKDWAKIYGNRTLADL